MAIFLYPGRRMQVGYEKNRDFRLVSHYISVRIQDMAIVAMECE